MLEPDFECDAQSLESASRPLVERMKPCSQHWGRFRDEYRILTFGQSPKKLQFYKNYSFFV